MEGTAFNLEHAGFAMDRLHAFLASKHGFWHRDHDLGVYVGSFASESIMSCYFQSDNQVSGLRFHGQRSVSFLDKTQVYACVDSAWDLDCLFLVRCGESFAPTSITLMDDLSVFTHRTGNAGGTGR